MGSGCRFSNWRHGYLKILVYLCVLGGGDWNANVSIINKNIHRWLNLKEHAVRVKLLNFCISFFHSFNDLISGCFESFSSENIKYKIIIIILLLLLQQKRRRRWFYLSIVKLYIMNIKKEIDKIIFSLRPSS